MIGLDRTSAHAGAGALPFSGYYDVGFRGQRTLLFLDYYPLMRCNGVRIQQSTARYVPGGAFVDPRLGKMTYTNPTSPPFFDRAAGLWRRYQGGHKIYAYESEDAIRWRISPQPRSKKQYDKEHPHHVFTAPVHGHDVTQPIISTFRNTTNYFDVW